MFDQLTTTEARELSGKLLRSTYRLNGEAHALLATGETVKAAGAMGTMAEQSELLLDLTHFRAQRAARPAPIQLDGCTCRTCGFDDCPGGTTCAWAAR